MVIEKGEIVEGRFSVPFRIYGTGERTMVCVSGAQQTMAVWRTVVSHFSKEFCIVTFDMPGLGRSKILDGPLEIGFDEQLQILHRIIESSGRVGPLTLVGVSWGTIVVAAYAARALAEVDTLVLASFGVRLSESMIELIKDGQSLYECGRIDQAAHLIIERIGQNITGAYKKQIVAQFERMTDDQARVLYSHCGFVDAVRHIEEYVALDRITARTLIINGENDTILDPEDMLVANARIRNCETRLVPNAGHFLHLERPDILNIYADFLAR